MTHKKDKMMHWDQLNKREIYIQIDRQRERERERENQGENKIESTAPTRSQLFR